MDVESSSLLVSMLESILLLPMQISVFMVIELELINIELALVRVGLEPISIGPEPVDIGLELVGIGLARTIQELAHMVLVKHQCKS